MFQHVHSTGTAQEIAKKMDEWNFERLEKFLIKKKKFTKTEIAIVRKEYTKYLALKILHPEKMLPMSNKVDDYWHGHILFTRDYVSFCKKFAGRYLHHNPAVDEAEIRMVKDHVQETANSMVENFGECNNEYWQDAEGVCDDWNYCN